MHTKVVKLLVELLVARGFISVYRKMDGRVVAMVVLSKLKGSL